MNTTRKGFLATLGALVVAPFLPKKKERPFACSAKPRLRLAHEYDSTNFHEMARALNEVKRKVWAETFSNPRIPFGPARSPGYSGILPPV